MKKKIFLLSLILLFIGCSNDRHVRVQETVIDTKGVKLEARDWEIALKYPARFRSVQQSNIYARVEGILMEQYFTEGSFVRQGEKLFKIEPTRYAALVEQLQADVNTAQANLKKASRDYERTKKLYQQKVITVDIYDISEFNYKTAKAKLENANAMLKNARIDLEYTDVRASISGRIGVRNYDIGNLVGNGSNNILTTITQLNPIYADFAIPNRDLNLIHQNDFKKFKVNYILSNGKRYKKKGQIDFLDSVLDRNTSSMRARAIVENGENLLTPNEFVELELEGIIRQSSIAIPQIALMQDNQGSFVYVFVPDQKNSIEGRVKKVFVQIGHITKNNLVIIDKGLHTGDYLIMNHLLRLKPDMKVQFEVYKPKGV